MKDVLKTLLTPIGHLLDKKAEKSEIGDKLYRSDIPTRLSQLAEDSSHMLVREDEKDFWDNKSDFSGRYADLTDTPWVPEFGQDILPENRISYERVEYDSDAITHYYNFQYCGTTDAVLREGDQVEAVFARVSGDGLRPVTGRCSATIKSFIPDAYGPRYIAEFGRYDVDGYTDVSLMALFTPAGKVYTSSSLIFQTTINDVTYVGLGISELYTSGKRYVASDNLPANVPAVNSAAVGQIVVVKAVDESGKPTEWEAANFPTNVSEFENDAGYLTEHQDLSAYAKTADIPKELPDVSDSHMMLTTDANGNKQWEAKTHYHVPAATASAEVELHDYSGTVSIINYVSTEANLLDIELKTGETYRVQVEFYDEDGNHVSGSDLNTTEVAYEFNGHPMLGDSSFLIGIEPAIVDGIMSWCYGYSGSGYLDRVDSNYQVDEGYYFFCRGGSGLTERAVITITGQEKLVRLDEKFMPLLTSPDGTKYTIAVDDAGALSAVKV